MFDEIAPRYDLLNRLMSAGIDRHCRAQMIGSLQLTGREMLLDVCTGTADVALEAADKAARVLGVDFCRSSTESCAGLRESSAPALRL